MSRIAIIDYKMGNLASLRNSFEKIGATAVVESDPDKIATYDKVLLPGVGAFGDAMDHLRATGMGDAIKTYAKSGKPLFGICLGLQLLFDSSCEFGDHQGLGLIAGDVVRFDESSFSERLKVPHMGWNELFITQESPLFQGMKNDFYLYFVHSYHIRCDDQYRIGRSVYGYEFACAVQKENIFGLQPHPEKSHDNGLKILKNFVEMS